eukprot:Protomagalhaensia_wolfi_Nauph_80__6071@NODE_852_length_1946_cov_198_891977_g640_i0_p1_GENE_NODE_852_length_1946_cov_198_891977_g640_i0NODE_852_length_1946_cov_198_891977_g640_i0_p1_ORF_typecomplete_len592_score157_77PGM_PMM_I/PF02878_16/3_7e41PGM_PMM_III/PF02880_16/2_4e21PGM_PMM_II/PF02879_16/1_8e19PGM_PMM_IV/PF00408_20/1_1e08Glyco_hydro_101/PF12905_7/0_14_NODE_852_length_1946_cov_198_891977_g640_i0971872
MTNVAAMIDKYRAWEYDQTFLDELNRHVNDEEFLNKRFAKNLKFGTAGLRSEMGCGWNAMNPVTVQQATQGVCQYYMDTMGVEECRKQPVVIGFDARYNSKWFAHITSAVFLSQGIPVQLFGSYTATPLCPYLVKKIGALCGIQITASHNPARDNGYKLYAGNGVQIIPPQDAETYKRLLACESSWPGVLELLDMEKKVLKPNPLVTDPLCKTWNDYKVDLAQGLNLLNTNLSQTQFKTVYTAVHGVGHYYVKDFLMEVLQLPETSFLAEPKQQEPDPDFPTVSYPNPEEPGALDLAKAYGDEKGVPLIIANDPDADRFAAAEKVEGKWRQFSGDELGAIFALLMFERAVKSGKTPDRLLMVNSAVSSRFMSRVCAVEGATYMESLTGFKWLMNTALQYEKELGLHVCLAYEEALGYGVSTIVPDKDGLTASAIFVEKAAEQYAHGSNMYEYLREGLMKYGFFATHNSYYRCTEPAAQAAVLEKFRNGGKYPTEIAGYKIRRIRDLKPYYDSEQPDKKCTLPKVSDDMLTIFFENGAHVTLRGSGTEPKFKYYSEMFHPTSSEEAKTQLVECIDRVLTEVLIGNEAHFSKP